MYAYLVSAIVKQEDKAMKRYTFFAIFGVILFMVGCGIPPDQNNTNNNTPPDTRIGPPKVETGKIKLVTKTETNIKFKLQGPQEVPDVKPDVEVKVKTGLYHVRTDQSGQIYWIDKSKDFTANVRSGLTTYKEFDQGFPAPKEADGFFCMRYSVKHPDRLEGRVEILDFKPDATKQRLRVSGLNGDWYVGPKYTLYYKKRETNYGNGTMTRNDDGSWDIMLKYRTEDIPDGLDFYTDKWRCVKKFN